MIDFIVFAGMLAANDFVKTQNRASTFRQQLCLNNSIQGGMGQIPKKAVLILMLDFLGISGILGTDDFVETQNMAGCSACNCVFTIVSKAVMAKTLKRPYLY